MSTKTDSVLEGLFTPLSISVDSRGGGVVGTPFGVRFGLSVGGGCGPGELEDALPGTQYVVSFYWAITTMTTVGFGDIVPTTNIERM